ncbi:asparagine synthetase B family protein [Nonomuraea bangladeshensis]|uniref:asparagine synthetase B family protein n=1 Tax=Nonomuraea bangladeshensis TaxID=404385 RepID=UPI0031CFC0CB
MCGVVAGLGKLDLGPAVAALAHRGPDAANMVTVAGVHLGHTRLAVQDLDPRSDQPFRSGPVTVAYNGEIYNAAELRQAVEERDPGRAWATTGDTEVLAAALAVLGPDRALPCINGMFAVAWADDRRPGVLHVARDRHGEIPLHLHLAQPVMAASELKAFAAAGRPMASHLIADVPAGQWGALHGRRAEWHRFHTQRCTPAGYSLAQASTRLKDALARAVQRRLIADVPVCSLLSGGIDSAAITYELAQHVPDLVAYTARMDPRSRDLRCAREVAEHLGIELVEVDIPAPTADDLARVVQVVEMPHKAQVEIGWACLLLAQRIRADGFKVTYSGEGSDELWASYGFAFHALQKTDWHIYRRDLMAAQSRKNFPRVNKTFMAHSVEGRLPFCDPDVVDLALSLQQHAVADGKAHPKAVLQRAYAGLLPESVVRRPKVAFQDGLGLKDAITAVLPNPARFYKAEYQRLVRNSRA